MSILSDYSWGTKVFIPSIRINSHRNQKPAFQRNFSVQKLSAAISKETTPINPQQKLAKMFEKQQEGALAALSKTFKPDEIEGFFLMGYIKRVGKNWKKTETGDKFVSQFYREPSPIEKFWGRQLSKIGF